MQVDQIAAELRAIDDRARAVVGRAGTNRLLQRPSGGGWSIAECLEHLNMTTRAFLPRWREACKSAPPSDVPYRTDFWGRVLIWVLEPPPKFRMPTTPAFQQIPVPAPDKVLDTFLQTQAEFLAAIEAGRGLALDRVKVRSPFQEKLQYSVWSSFRVSLAHERRHLWQAERVARLLP